MEINESNKNIGVYPYLQVIALFAIVGSMVSGLIAQLIILWIFKAASFVQIGYQPLVYVSLFGFIPALLTGMVLAYKKLGRTDKGSMQTTFLIGFLISALYSAAIVVYLGFNSPIEFGIMLTVVILVGLFGAINAIIIRPIVLPKACKTSFDKLPKKDHDVYKRYL